MSIDIDKLRPMLIEVNKDFNKLEVPEKDEVLYKLRKDFYSQINLFLSNTQSQDNLDSLLQTSYKLSTTFKEEMTEDFNTKLSKLQNALLSEAHLTAKQKKLFDQLMKNQNVDFIDRNKNEVVLRLKYDNPFSNSEIKSLFITIDKKGNFSVEENRVEIMKCAFNSDKVTVTEVSKDCGFKKEETLDVASYLSKLTGEMQKIDIIEEVTSKVSAGQEEVEKEIYRGQTITQDLGWGLKKSHNPDYPFSLRDYPEFRFKIATDSVGPGIAFKNPKSKEDVFISFYADPTSSESPFLRPQEVIRMAKEEFLDITEDSRQVKAEKDAKEMQESIKGILSRLENTFEKRIKIPDEPIKNKQGEDEYRLIYKPFAKAPIEIVITPNPKKRITITKEPNQERLVVDLDKQTVFATYKTEPYSSFKLEDTGRTISEVVEMWMQGKSLERFL